MNRYNPKGLRRNHRGQLLDKWGREMEVDWKEFEKKRLKPGDKLQSPKVLNPMHAAATPKRTSESVVDALLEADPDGIDDPLQYAYDTLDPQPRSGEHIDIVKFTRALRDELVERGWRHIRLQPVEDNQWYVSAGWIDERFRSHYAAMGWRVTPEPHDDWNLGGRVASSLKGGLRRVGCKLLSFQFDEEELQPVHDGLDLERLPDDFEDDQGDWRVSATFTFAPGPKFWKMLQNATPPDPPPPPRPPVKSLLTPEQQDKADEEHRYMMARMRERALAADSEWEKKRKDYERRKEADTNTPFPPDLM